VVDHLVAAQGVRQAVRLAAELGPDGCRAGASCNPTSTDLKIANRVLSITGIGCGAGTYLPTPGGGTGGMRDFEVFEIQVRDARTGHTSSYRPCGGSYTGAYPLNERGNKPPTVGRIEVGFIGLYRPAMAPGITFPIEERAIMDIQQDL
ncbi:MAG: hypothetical protein QOE92_1201, partial [Chloroflexota bacterium]|nr:hypothetical protein [Chloroflexota bacterium]